MYVIIVHKMEDVFLCFYFELATCYFSSHQLQFYDLANKVVVAEICLLCLLASVCYL